MWQNDRGTFFEMKKDLPLQVLKSPVTEPPLMKTDEKAEEEGDQEAEETPGRRSSKGTISLLFSKGSWFKSFFRYLLQVHFYVYSNIQLKTIHIRVEDPSHRWPTRRKMKITRMKRLNLNRHRAQQNRQSSMESVSEVTTLLMMRAREAADICPSTGARR